MPQGLVVPGAPSIGNQGQGLSGLSAVLWTPLSLGAGLIDDIDASYTAGLTMNGANVSSLVGRNGVMTLSQATAANQPGYSGSGLVFSSSSQIMSISAVPASYEVAIAAIPLAAGSYRTLLSGSNHSYVYAILNTGSNNIGVYSVSSFQQVGSNTWPNVAGLLYCYFVANSVVYMARDGVALTVDITPSPTIPSFAATSIGNNEVGAGQPFGTIFEIVFMTLGQSTSVRNKVAGYLAWKWGTQTLLPSNHPYYSRPPYVSDP